MGDMAGWSGGPADNYDDAELISWHSDGEHGEVPRRHEAKRGSLIPKVESFASGC